MINKHEAGPVGPKRLALPVTCVLFHGCQRERAIKHVTGPCHLLQLIIDMGTLVRRKLVISQRERAALGSLEQMEAKSLVTPNEVCAEYMGHE